MSQQPTPGDAAPTRARSTPRRPDRPPRAPSAEQDLQVLAVRALHGLTRMGVISQAAVIGSPTGGEAPALLAASRAGAIATRSLSRADLDLLTSLEGATDLGGEAAGPQVRALGERLGFSIAAPARAGDGAALWVVLAGGSGAPLGAVPPRALAAVGAAAARLGAAAATAHAAARLSRLDEEVRRLDRAAALGDLVAEIVHEVRNPLVSVKTFLQLLPERHDDPDFRDHFFPVVQEEVRRIERLLDLVLEHARPRREPPPDAAAPVEPVLDAVIRLVGHRAQERGVGLSQQVEGPLPPAALTDDRLRQVVLNLTLNAIDATPSGGLVTLRGRRVGERVAVEVEDSGPGIAPERRALLFEPFYSTKSDRPGGLGLAITRRIVEQASGSIEVCDRAGGGSVFRVEIPVASA
jgi:signal transduction histidine kinase